MSATVTVPVIYRQVGWMKCVACSDTRLFPGRMWLGHTPGGADIWIDCPSCKGTGQVPRYQILDAKTGVEIDYEAHGLTSEGEPLHHYVPQQEVPS